MWDEDILIPLGFFAMIAVPIIVSTLVRHQQRMAEILHGRQASDEATERLAREVSELRQTVAQQAILLDTLVNEQRKATDSLQQRVG